ncbi:MAG: bi-domain-containing oxidoreductase [Planctomycetota bacterium]
MKQVIQNYRTGVVKLADVPIPVCSKSDILVRNIASLISIGTERSIIDLGRKSLLGKAKARPDLVKRFVDKTKKEGFIKTFREALGRLDNPVSLGYSCSGIIVEVGENVHKLCPGDRVGCIGAGCASHSEYVRVPENLCCRLPKKSSLVNQQTDQDETISFEEAAFGMLGTIAMHGIRCARLNPGETVTIIGLGLLGLLSVQICKAYGYKVIGTDIDASKVGLAKTLGADCVFGSGEDIVQNVNNETQGYGSDAVIITAATKSDEPINKAVEISRQKGRIVVVGVADIHPSRNEMWHKEVEIVVSKAGGPGIFDPLYERQGIDYPFGEVRWTQNRNLEHFYQLIADGKVDTKTLITHRFPIEQSETVYKNILDDKGGPYIGVLLEYPDAKQPEVLAGRMLKMPKAVVKAGGKFRSTIGVIGAGLFGKALLLPALKTVPDIEFRSLATSSGENSYHVAEKYGFSNYTTDYKDILSDDSIDTVIILTPHSMHAKMVLESLRSGKNVFVEKPLAVNEAELREIIDVCQNVSDKFLNVGYNRRYSPHAEKMAGFLKGRHNPVVVAYRVNAGFVPADHWVHSPAQGGGRVIGEICHFVDMLQFLCKSNPARVFAERISGNNKTAINNDNIAVTLKFEDGSVGNIVYSASGDKAFSRERIEVYFDGNTIVCDDYRRTYLYAGSKTAKFKTANQQMGYSQELRNFFDVITGKAEPTFSNKQIFISTLTVFKINESLEKGEPVEVNL